MVIQVYLFCNEKESKFKPNNKNVNFPTKFYLESITNNFSLIDSRDIL